jgi:hypothetical protein
MGDQAVLAGVIYNEASGEQGEMAAILHHEGSGGESDESRSSGSARPLSDMLCMNERGGVLRRKR